MELRAILVIGTSLFALIAAHLLLRRFRASEKAFGIANSRSLFRTAGFLGFPLLMSVVLFFPEQCKGFINYSNDWIFVVQVAFFVFFGLVVLCSAACWHLTATLRNVLLLVYPAFWALYGYAVSSLMVLAVLWKYGGA